MSVEDLKPIEQPNQLVKIIFDIKRNLFNIYVESNDEDMCNKIEDTYISYLGIDKNDIDITEGFITYNSVSGLFKRKCIMMKQYYSKLFEEENIISILDNLFKDRYQGITLEIRNKDSNLISKCLELSYLYGSLIKPKPFGYGFLRIEIKRDDAIEYVFKATDICFKVNEKED